MDYRPIDFQQELNLDSARRKNVQEKGALFIRRDGIVQNKKK